MNKLITDLNSAILDKWDNSKSIPVSDLPDFEKANLSKLIINYGPPWFVALLNPVEEIVIVTYAKVDKPADLPHLLLNYDHISTKEYFVKYPSKYLLIQKSDRVGLYKTEFYDHKRNLIKVENCTAEEFLVYIENEFKTGQ
ncbi:hypothetical protein [Dyadobacter psychrotolerans]|uniref:Uncharacterized protein n=1 Tax=Dyadobacter psychrotolerans TaxID=2541721 RepID=A0A4R5DL90_9BACT|nr:hypothetical protein [Dyadobacter psychrotolerans]TDE14849.1 hypothetical protein E0F88_16855 [Dyadobacter psychrotolerans]